MHSTADMRHDAQLWSVRDLLEQLEGSEAWTLAVAQRAFEWDAQRVTNLVDSVLRGFPIGSLLLARQPGQHYPLSDRRALRDLREHAGESTQLLDGQQRCQALLATFRGEGLRHPKTGRHQKLWIHVAAPNPRYLEFSRKDGGLYLMRWLDSDRDLNALSDTDRRAEGMHKQGGEPRDGWLPFHRLVARVEQNARPRTLAKEAGADFDSAGVEEHLKTLKARVEAALDRKYIPVHVLHPPQQGESVSDLHQVFVRLNVGGKPLSPADEFFAGVKRYWPQAEAGVRPLLETLSPLHRRGSITLLARLANHTLPKPQGDPSPLRLDALARSAQSDGSNPLAQRIQAISEDTSEQSLVHAMRWLSDRCLEHFHGGIHGIGESPWMAAVAWAWAWAQKRPLPAPDDRVQLRPLCQFLFWTSVLNSSTYGRGRFTKWVFSKCWNAGLAGRPLPVDDRYFERRCFDFSYVQDVLPRTHRLREDTPAEDRKKIDALMRRNRWLFLGPFQEIGKGRRWTPEQRQAPGIEWDHIVPFDKARSLFKKSRSYLWEYTDFINATGNFAGIDARANRVFNDCSIARKLGWESTDPTETYRDFAFVRTHANLSPGEEESLQLVNHEIEVNRDRLQGGEAFLRFVHHRSRRIWRHACQHFAPPPLPTSYADKVTR